MDEDSDIAEERGDACPCKRQRVVTKQKAGPSGEGPEIPQIKHAKNVSSTSDESVSPESSREQELLTADLNLATGLHLASNLDLSDDPNLNSSDSNTCQEEYFDDETGETLIGQLHVRQTANGLGHLHSNSALPGNSNQAMEINSDTAAVAENSYIKSVEKSVYGYEAGKLDQSVRFPPERMSDSGFIDLFSSDYTLSSDRHRPVRNLASSHTQSYLAEYDSPPAEQSSARQSTLEPRIGKLRNRLFALDTSEEIQSLSDGFHINRLPLSILLHMFRYFTKYMLLRKTSLVCKYWYNLSRDPDLWRYISLKNQHRLENSVLKELVLFSDRVLYLNLTDCRFISDVGVRAVLSSCSHIRTLKLMRCYEVTDETFVGFGASRLCPHLQSLHLDHCYNITDRSLLEIADGCPDMQVLHLNQCTKVTDIGVQAVARSCTRLKQLLLDHCDKVRDSSAVELANHCSQLQYLNVMCCGLSDDGVTEFAKLTNLHNLDLSNIPRLTPSALIHVVKSCKLLECINISLNVVMNDQCVSAIAQNCHNLKRLYCVSCSITDKGLEDIARFRPTIEALDVGWCQDITDEGIRVISLACKQLGYLGLIRCDRITVQTVEELVLRYPNINFSTFILESQRLIERARREGFRFAAFPAESSKS